MSDASRVTAVGRFADPAAEREYRAARFAADRTLGRLLVLSILTLDFAFVPIDLLNYGPTRDGLLAAMLRLACVGWSAACWWWVGRAADAVTVERRVLLWVPPVLGLNMLSLHLLGGNHLGAAAAFAVGVVLSYLLPVRLEWGGAVGLSVTGLYLGMLLANQRPDAAGHLLIDTGVGFVMANGTGLAVGRLLQLDRRRQHAAAAALARAADELKTLRGLLPICACCKSIRDDAGHWQRLEKYIQAHTPATFTHGICPDCMVREYGVTPDGLKLPTVVRD